MCPEAITVTHHKVAFITGVARGRGREEAVELANSTPYGLGANIQSTSLTRVHRLAERLKAGGVYVNGARQNLPHTPFGGLGISGYGKEGGRAGIDEFLRYKTVSLIEAP